MTLLRDANILLTGASRGIGPYIARALASHGANLALTARTVAPLEELAAELERAGTGTAAIPADLALPDDRVALAGRATEALGPIDILVNNAALESGGAFTDLDARTIAQTVEVNLTAPMHLARLVVPGMIDRSTGHIVTISSTGGKRGVAYNAVYCGTKAGVIEWSNGLRAELARSGVKVSVICPGYVTQVGMFAKFGMDPPAVLGSCTPGAVAAAVVRAIDRNRPEIIVNSRPLRPLLALGALSPRFSDWMIGALGITEFQRRKARKVR